MVFLWRRDGRSSPTTRRHSARARRGRVAVVSVGKSAGFFEIPAPGQGAARSAPSSLVPTAFMECYVAEAGTVSERGADAVATDLGEVLEHLASGRDAWCAFA